MLIFNSIRRAGCRNNFTRIDSRKYFGPLRTGIDRLSMHHFLIRLQFRVIQTVD